MYPVFKSWEVSPAIAAMMQITDPILIAAAMPAMPVMPDAFKIMVEISSVAMAMPETGLFELPTRPTIREDTVAKKKPNIIIITAPNRFTGIKGHSHIKTAITPIPAITKFIGRSCVVRFNSPAFTPNPFIA